jgi:hypothetical protein
LTEVNITINEAGALVSQLLWDTYSLEQMLLAFIWSYYLTVNDLFQCQCQTSKNHGELCFLVTLPTLPLIHKASKMKIQGETQ